ncbi:MAG: hypothetical protein Tsb0016_12130 [Sphingomonadales bacterium]
MGVGDVLRLARGFRLEDGLRTAVALQPAIQRLRAEWPAKAEKERTYILKRFERQCESLTDARQRVYHLSLLHEFTGAYRYLPPIFHYALHECDALAERYGLWSSLLEVAFAHRSRFSPWQAAKLDTHLRKLYRVIFEQVSGQLQNVPALAADYRPVDNRLLLVTTQFLLGKHAPTQRVLAFARHAISALGMEVMIYNASTVPRAAEAPYHNVYLANYMEQLDTVTCLEIEPGIHCQFAQNPARVLNFGAVDAMADVLAAFKPAKVVAMGPGNLMADVLRASVPVAALPSTAILPISEAGGIATVAPPTPLEQALLKPFELPADAVSVIPTGFQLPAPSTPLSRTDLGLAPDAFLVLVVGNRLHAELTDRVAAIMQRLIAAAPSLHFALMGLCEDFDDWLARHPALRGRVHFSGFQADLLGAMAVGDYYLDLPRQGGGTAMAYALANGMPVAALGGDGANVAGDGLTMPSLSAAADDILAVIANSEHGAVRRAQSQARWREIGDYDSMVKAVLSAARQRPLPRTTQT